MKIRHYLFSCLLVGYCQFTLAQNPYIRHYTTANGLPSNTIYQIFQDSHKFLWFTSDAGVVKFDGSSFITYRKKDGLSSNDIVRMNEDPKGRIWFFNYNSSVNFLLNDTIHNIKNTPFLNQLIGRGFIINFIVEPDTTLVFYNWQQEIFRLDKYNRVTMSVVLKNLSMEMPLVGNNYDRIKILYIKESSPLEYILWTNVGIYNQLISTGEISTVIKNIQFTDVFPTKGKNLYATTYFNSIIRISDNYQIERINHRGNIRKVKTILEDSDGYIWVAALDEGVYCYYQNQLIRHFRIKEAHGLMQDHEKNIWVSTRSDGVYTINHDLLTQDHIESDHFNGQGLTQLYDLYDKGILAMNNSTLFYIQNKNISKLSLPSELQPLNFLFYFNDKSLLISSLDSKVCLLTNALPRIKSTQLVYLDSSIFDRPLKKIVYNKSKQLIAFYQQNYLLVAPNTSASLKLDFFRVPERINNAFFNNNDELIINSKKNYYFSNYHLEHSRLLSFFDGNIISEYLSLNDSVELFNIEGDSVYFLYNKHFYNVTKAFNAPITVPIKKVIYKYPNLYLATYRDIFICKNPLYIIKGVSLHLNPFRIRFNNINDFLVKDDSLYVASDDGLTIIAESSIAKSVSDPPIPYLKSIEVNDVSLTNLQDITLTGKNKILLNFGCISYFTSSIIYSYMLYGSEDNWTTGTGSEINIVYQNLPKGKYTFKLRVRKSNSDWSKPLELPITIKPTLVEYPLFWAFTAMLLSGMIFLIIYRMRVQKMKKVEIDHQLVVMEQKALQSMMNPHFIFNSLSSVQNYLLKNKGDEAVIYLSNFSRLIRQNLNAINTPMIELSEEINRLRNYLELEKKRLDNKFDYSIQIENTFDAEDIFIPSMVIQPFAENSIWHGLSTLDENGMVRIGFYVNDSKSLKIIVEDNGIGIKKSTEYYSENSHKKHLGMQIIRKRLDLLSKKYNTATSIHVTECFPDQTLPGTKVELIVPFLFGLEDNETGDSQKKN